MTLRAIVLTYNEERHIERCLQNLRSVASEVLVVDSYSSDRTVELAQQAGAKVIQNPWENHATQFNWALERLPIDTGWVLRLDADEWVNEKFILEVKEKLPYLADNVDGVSVNRHIVFSGKKIRYGGVLPLRVIRLFRFGHGRSENRWMDEHIIVDGDVVEFQGEIIDHNLNSLSWWTDKHNRYASREAVELLNLTYGFMPRDQSGQLSTTSQAGLRRWVKEKIYSRLPTGSRALAYFLYRYVIRLGFLDGRAGTEFHFLQGFWYRYLVDAKVREVIKIKQENEMDISDAIAMVLEIKV